MREAIESDAYVVRGDALERLRQLPSNSVHCIVTSPPYWQLRDYGCDGQLGLEKTPGEYVAKLVRVFREARRVLRPDGTFWLNTGDSFIHYGNPTVFGGGQNSMGNKRNEGKAYPVNKRYTKQDLRDTGLKEKDLVGIPWQLAFALRDDGWYFRGDIVWQKPKIFPESVKDRPTRSHEFIFLFSKSERYYYDHKAIKERAKSDASGKFRNRRSVWRISTTVKRWSFCLGCKSLYEGPNRHLVRQIGKRRFCPTCGHSEKWLDHFASFPTKLARLCILAGTCDGGCCVSCGTPRYYLAGKWMPNCGCHTASVPCIVLDPFCGSANSGMAARRTARAFCGIDLKPEFVSLANARLNHFDECTKRGDDYGSKKNPSGIYCLGFRHEPHGYGLLPEAGTDPDYRDYQDDAEKCAG